MRWKQFFTPVQSMDGLETRKFLEQLSGDDYNLIDVRQPGEYKDGHLPGAKLIPLGDLADRARELDPDKPTVVY
ncbi:Rhodanese-like domain-containing protein [Desulfopila aestuarii DSM 18488]|uniref:Rhodanese-like domain-containing protein n=3 Tax=Desulfopila aestuarii TaxID=231440 RepID=A0A1M7XX28_9BACT|nr:Rhodanese-like domain-containing protein [Desulfopila aestuarii DSM 18488]